MQFRRVAIYYLPPSGPLYDFGAAWLGWDIRRGVATARPDCIGLDLDALTRPAQRYGFHATLKPPFALAAGQPVGGLQRAFHALAARLGPVNLQAGLAPDARYGFAALIPRQESPALNQLAADIVRGLDGFRAPLTAEDRARRRPERLTAKQRGYLERWGYPWVMDAFRFHITLTGPLEKPQKPMAVLDRLLPPTLSQPHEIATISLVGEAADGRFHLIDEAALTGPPRT